MCSSDLGYAKGVGPRSAFGHYFSTTPEGAIAIKTLIESGVPQGDTSGVNYDAYQSVIQANRAEVQQSSLVADNKALIDSTPFLGTEIGTVLHLCGWGQAKIVAGQGIMFNWNGPPATGFFEQTPVSADTSTNYSNFLLNEGLFAGYITQEISGNLVISNIKAVPQGRANGAFFGRPNEDIWGMHCIWDLANGAYKGDYRTWNSSTNQPNSWFFGSNSDTGYNPKILNFGSWTVEGARQLAAKRVELGLVNQYGEGAGEMFNADQTDTACDSASEALLAAIVNSTRPDQVQESLINNIDTIQTVAKSGLDKYTSADAGPGWNSDNSKWSSGEMPPAGILVTDWLKAQRVSERDVSYSFPSVALTKYEPAAQAHLRTYWANGPFIFAGGQTEKNVTQIHTFTVGMKGSTASRLGKLYGTIHEGMDFKPAYHCDEVMDFSQIMVVDLSGKQLKRNYKVDGSGNPDLSGSPLRPQNLSGTAALDAENYFTLEDSSNNTFLYLFQVQPYQFEFISSPPSAENDWEAGYAYAPSGEMMNGDHALMIEYDPSDFSIVRTTGYNTGMPNGLLNPNNFVGYNVYSPGWHTTMGMDLVAKIGMGSAQREFMANNPGVKFQSVGVLDTRSD